MNGPNLTVMGQILLFSIILLIGNVSWKMGILKINGFMMGDKTLIQNLMAVASSPWMWLGGVFYVLGTLVWFYIISRHDLSYVYPMVSISYILTAVAGVIIFKEQIPPIRMVGMGIVSLGFVVLSFK